MANILILGAGSMGTAFSFSCSDNNHLVSKGLDGLKCEFVSSIDTVHNNTKKTILLTVI